MQEQQLQTQNQPQNNVTNPIDLGAIKSDAFNKQREIVHQVVTNGGDVQQAQDALNDFRTIKATELMSAGVPEDDIVGVFKPSLFTSDPSYINTKRVIAGHAGGVAKDLWQYASNGGHPLRAL